MSDQRPRPTLMWCGTPRHDPVTATAQRVWSRVSFIGAAFLSFTDRRYASNFAAVQRIDDKSFPAVRKADFGAETTLRTIGERQFAALLRDHAGDDRQAEAEAHRVASTRGVEPDKGFQHQLQ